MDEKLIDVRHFLKKAAEKCGFQRDRFNEGNIPTNPDKLTVMPFFGDLRGLFVLSSFLLKPYREILKPSKYFVVATWPGCENLFPYVDEVWSIRSYSNLDRFFGAATGFSNMAEEQTIAYQNLNRFFDDVVVETELDEYYKNGLTAVFREKFKTIHVSYPMVPSSSILGGPFARALMNKPGYKVVVHPAINVKGWRGRVENVKTPMNFWIKLVERLIDRGMVPIVANIFGTHDISTYFGDKCVYGSGDVGKVMAVMRISDCVLDIFSDISKLAIPSRSPYLAFCERNKHTKARDYEIDDLCAADLPKQYIFSFTTILNNNEYSWGVNIFDSAIAKLEKFLPSIDRDALPSGSELTREVSYEKVRKRRVMKFGTKFIKVQQD
jgi:hypothetical protein